MTDELRWDFATSVEEVMTHLHTFVMARQVLYLGVSDTPAWVVVKANECKPWTWRSPSHHITSSDFALQLPARTG
jgi:aryl-alcohol dehydrogenase-like predicted oxidoreductase